MANEKSSSTSERAAAEKERFMAWQNWRERNGFVRELTDDERVVAYAAWNAAYEAGQAAERERDALKAQLAVEEQLETAWDAGHASGLEEAAKTVESAPAGFNRNDHAERIRLRKNGDSQP